MIKMKKVSVPLGWQKEGQRPLKGVETLMVRRGHLTRTGGMSVMNMKSSRQKALSLKLVVSCARSKAE